jgi:cardiolipin synthase
MAGDSDVPIAKYAERWLYDWLLRHHVTLYEYRPNVLHGKIAVMDDGISTIGSYNVNNISAYASVEMNIVIREKSFIHELRNELNLIKQKECTIVDKSYHLNHKTWLKQFVRFLSYVIYRFIFIITTFYYKQNPR